MAGELAQSFLRKMATLDRRWIYLTVALAALLPLIFPLRLPMEPSGPVKELYQAVEALPDGCTVICAFDYEPGSAVELEPAAMATIRHLWRKNIKIISFSLWPAGSAVTERAYSILVAKLKKEGITKEYGKDWVNLGYKAGMVVALRNMGSGFSNVFPKDVRGTPVSEIPLMRRVNRYSDISMLLTYSVGEPGIKQHMQVVAGQYGVPVGGAVTAVNAPEMIAYLNSHQIVGLMGGLRGAADYEILVGAPGTAMEGMNVQSIVHLVICAFIILSNVAWFAGRRGTRGRRA